MVAVVRLVRRFGWMVGRFWRVVRWFWRMVRRFFLVLLMRSFGTTFIGHRIEIFAVRTTQQPGDQDWFLNDGFDSRNANHKVPLSSNWVEVVTINYIQSNWKPENGKNLVHVITKLFSPLFLKNRLS